LLGGTSLDLELALRALQVDHTSAAGGGGGAREGQGSSARGRGADDDVGSRARAAGTSAGQRATVDLESRVVTDLDLAGASDLQGATSGNRGGRGELALRGADGRA